MDYLGPLYCHDLPNMKFYVCLFTCGVVRAIHLELTSALSSSEFLHAFRRFAARRGLPKFLYSDNAKNFTGSVKALQSVYGSEMPKWKFIVPRSPWWGGWWERLVRSVKSAVKRSVGRRSLSRAEIETLLVEIEYCINSRPLTYVSYEVHVDRPLTPNHFLLGDSETSVGPVVEELREFSLSDVFTRRKQSLDKFWRIWSTEYLRNLPCIVPQFQEKGYLKVGSVVLVREDNVPRLN